MKACQSWDTYYINWCRIFLSINSIFHSKGVSTMLQYQHFKECHVILVGGFNFQPLWKILVKMGSSSPNRGENKKYLKPPPSIFGRKLALCQTERNIHPTLGNGSLKSNLGEKGWKHHDILKFVPTLVGGYGYVTLPETNVIRTCKLLVGSDVVPIEIISPFSGANC